MTVTHRYCRFSTPAANVDKTIRGAFAKVRETVVSCGIHSGTLLHIGVVELDGETLVGYDYCIEFPLPLENIPLRTLPGGCYAIMTVEKLPRKIGRAIRQFVGDYIPEHELVLDDARSIYEIYYQDTLENCLPVW